MKTKDEDATTGEEDSKCFSSKEEGMITRDHQFARNDGGGARGWVTPTKWR